jgi:hypothetical protein
MSRSVGGPLADDALESRRDALAIVYAKPHAVRIAKIELGKIAVQCFSLQCWVTVTDWLR